MAISYDPDAGGIVVIPDDCPDCGTPLYDGGCDAPGHIGRGCPDCGWGCDLDLALADESRCAVERAAEDPDERAERLDAERAFWGLS